MSIEPHRLLRRIRYKIHFFPQECFITTVITNIFFLWHSWMKQPDPAFCSLVPEKSSSSLAQVQYLLSSGLHYYKGKEILTFISKEFQILMSHFVHTKLFSPFAREYTSFSQTVTFFCLFQSNWFPDYPISLISPSKRTPAVPYPCTKPSLIGSALISFNPYNYSLSV